MNDHTSGIANLDAEARRRRRAQLWTHLMAVAFAALVFGVMGYCVVRLVISSKV